MRRFRISLSLQVAILCAYVHAPVDAADVVSEFLGAMHPDEEHAIVWVISSDRRQRLWLDDLLSSAAWRRVVDPCPTVSVCAEKSPSVLLQFGVKETPLCLLLEANGREVGRVRPGDPPEDLLSRLSDLLVAAGAYKRYGGEVDVSNRDLDSLFWVGYFHWSRGEHFKARRSFQDFTSLPFPEDGADRELRARALYRLGEYALEGGRFPAAAAFFEQALKLTENAARAARCALAQSRCLRRLGKPEEAIRSLEEQLQSGSSSRLHDRLLFSLGYLYMDLGDRRMAHRSFSACKRSYPDSTYGKKSAHYLQVMGLPGSGKDTAH